MAKMSELWEKMDDGDSVKDAIGAIATRQGENLLWDDDGERLTAYYLLAYSDWELVKEEEKEMETEKWMRDDDKIATAILYADSKRSLYTPSQLINQRAFLRFVGKMPDEVEGIWPGTKWCIWLHEGEKTWWTDKYLPESGYTKQIFADYAEMRKEG